MFFEGTGASFVTAFRERIHHILEANGAFYNGTKDKGHAQKNQNISFNLIQPYPEGELKGLFPTIIIRPWDGSWLSLENDASRSLWAEQSGEIDLKARIELPDPFYEFLSAHQNIVDLASIVLFRYWSPTLNYFL